MAYGANTTFVTYRLLRGSRPIDLEVTPLVTYRSFHALASGQGWNIGVEPQERGSDDPRLRRSDAVLAALGPGRVPARRRLVVGFPAPRGDRARPRPITATSLRPASFVARLEPGETVALIYSTEPEPDLDAAASLAAAQQRQRSLLTQAGAEDADPVAQQLVLAADQFLVARPLPDDPGGRSVIAGYHWFNDWGRDTMISLPGLTLATGRAEEAASILRTFARYLADGLLPNNFPDSAGVIPGYNTADATLWYVLAIRAYQEATGDDSLVTDLLPALREIVERHLAGTRYGIGVDPADGLLRAGEPGVQLTWMDAKVGDWVVTPRIGKPVEINALWYNALRTVAEFLAARGDAATARRFDALADRTRDSFRARFRRPDLRPPRRRRRRAGWRRLDAAAEPGLCPLAALSAARGRRGARGARRGRPVAADQLWAALAGAGRPGLSRDLRRRSGPARRVLPPGSGLELAAGRRTPRPATG